MNDLERFAAFNSGLASLLRSGLPLDSALQSLARELGRSRFRKAVRRVEEKVREGTPLSDAVAEERVFPRYYAALVRAGEETGELPELLLQAAREARTSAEILARVRTALTYPGLVAACAFGMMFLFGFYAGPVFGSAYESMETEWTPIPTATRVALSLAGVMPQIGLGGLGAMAGLSLYAVAARAFGLPRPALAVFGWLPPVRSAEVARFAGTLNLLTSSGVGLPAALELVGEMMHVPAFGHACLRISRRVTEGEPLASALREERVFPYFFSWAVGAEEGRAGFGEILGEMGLLYQERARRSGEILSLIITPAALAVVGLVVGALVFSMYMPLFVFFRPLGMY